MPKGYKVEIPICYFNIDIVIRNCKGVHLCVGIFN